MKIDPDKYKYRGFLPNYFIKIGIALVILFVLFFVSGMIFEKSITVEKEIIATIGLDGVILGLLLICISKNKIEDEMIHMLRLQAFTRAFIFGTAYVFAVTITTLIMNDELPLTPHSLIIIELLMFIFHFEISKRKLNKQ
ncbi:MAG: hypothetical protein JW723_14720 [Bacteroidales bacterium]|nr:hypothetical protein [Bacteroidales bacterium]